jgi:parvulin-like peptidyl-prolyl isomerase
MKERDIGGPILGDDREISKVRRFPPRACADGGLRLRWGWYETLAVLAAVALLLCSVASCDGAAGDRTPAGEVYSSPVPESSVAEEAPPVASPTVASLLAEATVTPTVPPTPPAPLAAIVNGQYIFLSEYERWLAQYEQALEDEGVALSSEEGQEYLSHMRVEVLDNLIDIALLEQAAPVLGIVVSQDEVTAQVQSDIEAGGGLAAFEDWLQATNQTRDQYQRMVYEAVLVQRVLDVISADVPEAVEQVRIRHIQVDTEETARTVLELLGQGHDFEELAGQYSMDLATKDDGGDMGWFARNTLDPALEAVAFMLSPGEIGEPFWLGEGYQIVQVVEREANRLLSPEDRLELQLAIFDEYLSALRQSAVIELFVSQ